MPCPETNVKKAMDVHVYEGKLANFGILLQIDNMFQTFHLYLITKATFAFYKLKFWEVCSNAQSLILKRLRYAQCSRQMESLGFLLGV